MSKNSREYFENDKKKHKNILFMNFKLDLDQSCFVSQEVKIY
jgi:hypothetical protein